MHFVTATTELLPVALSLLPLLPPACAQVGKFLAKYSQMEMFPVKLQVRVGCVHCFLACLLLGASYSVAHSARSKWRFPSCVF